MNKTRLNQILRILSLPYIESGLAKKDSFKETIKAYCAYIEDTKQFNPARKTSAERNYAKMREAYVLFLAQKLEGPPQSLDDVFLISDKFFARSRVLDFVDRYHQKAGDMVDYLYIDNIFQIANSLLTTRDGIIAIRTWKNKPKPDFEEDIFGTGSAFHKVEIWNALTRILPTDIFIAAFVVINSADIRLLYRQHATISLADKLLAQVLEKGTAETHLHKNASVDYQMTWEQFMTYAFWEHQYLYPENSTFDEAYAIYLAYLYRMLTACYLENLFDDKTFLFYITDRFNEIYDCFIYGKKESWKSDEKKQVFLEHQFAKYREFLFQYDLNTEKEILDLTDYDCCDDLQTHTELVFMVKALERCRDMQTFPLFRLLFLQYLRIKNQFYQNFLQQNSIPGLNWFQLHFRKASQYFRTSFFDDKKQWRAIFENQMFIPSLKKLEIRCSVDYDKPIYEENDPLLLLEMKKIILKDVKKFLNVYRDMLEVYEHVPMTGVILHFNKRDALDNTSGFYCWRMARERQLFDSDHFLAVRRKYVFLAHAIAELRNEITYLNEYLVGLDAASVENNAEPWIFAPAFNQVRKRSDTHGVKKIRRPDDGSEKMREQFRRIQNIGLTYHVGEDFRHLLSGLRHIDEVIEQFNYRPCDRLGHAIALGVDLEYWVRQNSNIALPIGEHLENLLWLWGILGEDTCHFTFNTLSLEKEILDCAKKIYQNMNGITVYALYEAYQKKFQYDLSDVFEECYPADNKDHFNVCPYNMDMRRDREKNWTVSELVCTFFCPVYVERYRQVIWLEISKEDIPWLSQVQNYVLEKVQRRGIYVETNPTSNLAIGAIEELYKHHMFRLNAPEISENVSMKRHIMATINSDDTAVFNTNVENEIAYVYHSLVEKGYPSEILLTWIDKIRQYGMDSSFIKEIKDKETVKAEIACMLREIEEYD